MIIADLADQGIGRALVATFEDEARRRGALALTLGYVVTGVMPDANGPGRPDICMSKAVRRGR